MSYVYQTYSTNPSQTFVDLSGASFNLEKESSDTSPPLLLSIFVNQPSYYSGETITIEADVTDNEGSGVGSVYLIYKKPITQELKLVHLISENGKFISKLDLDYYDEKGLWKFIL